MGCDIHTITEQKYDDIWRAKLLGEPIFNWRNYGLYGFLADTCNYSRVPYRIATEGWPYNISCEAINERSKWDGNAHSFYHVLASSLFAFNYDQTFENRRTTKTVGNFTDGAHVTEPGEGKVVSYRDFLGVAYFKELERLKELHGQLHEIRVLMFFDN